MERKEPLRNVIPEPSESEMEYELLPDGIHLYGLVGVKNCMKKRFKAEGEDPAFRLIFRSKENPNSFCNVTYKASVWETSGMFKALMLMSGGRFKKLPGKKHGDKDEGFKILDRSVGHWFRLMIQYREYADKAYNNLLNHSIIPDIAADSELGDCNLWFKGHPGEANKSPAAIDTGFEGIPDHETQAELDPAVHDLTGDDIRDQEDLPF